MIWAIAENVCLMPALKPPTDFSFAIWVVESTGFSGPYLRAWSVSPTTAWKAAHSPQNSSSSCLLKQCMPSCSWSCFALFGALTVCFAFWSISWTDFTNPVTPWCGLLPSCSLHLTVFLHVTHAMEGTLLLMWHSVVVGTVKAVVVGCRV